MKSQLNIGLRFLLGLVAVQATEPTYNNLGECRVLLTVSPLTRVNADGDQVPYRDLAVAWEYPLSRCSSLRFDRIEIIDNKPSLHHKTLWSISPTESGSYTGHKVTNVSISPFGNIGKNAGGVSWPLDLPCGWVPPPDPMKRSSMEFIPAPNPGPCCIASYWAVAYSVTGKVLDYACVRIQPTWMGDHADDLDELTVDQVFIPGTHNTGSFARYPYQENRLWRFILTQDLPLWHQLVLGVRHLDLRIGYYPDPIGASAEPESPDKEFDFWINHDMIRVQPLLPLLRTLKAFLVVAPKEVVILDFHRFPVGFGSNNDSDPRAHAHEKLLDLLQTELGDYMAIAPPNMEGPLPPFRKYQNGPERVLVFYGKKGFEQDYPFVWPPLNQVWADARRPPALITALQDAMSKLPFKRQVWAAMAELTPSAYDVLFNFQGSLRKFAEEVNYDISSKLFFDWQYDANIVAVDFVMGSSVVEAAIVANQKKAKSKVSAREQEATKTMLRPAAKEASAAHHLKASYVDYYYYYDDNTTDPTSL